MTEHTLTDQMCLELSGFPLDEMAEDWAEWQREDMRAAADWQLEQVMKWLSKNLRNYTDDTYLGIWKPLHMLESDLEEAMCTTQQENN